MKYKVGDNIISRKCADEPVLQAYAQASGDYNALHMDDDYARNHRFGKRIIHGLFCIGEISRLLGTVFPGNGTIILQQEIKYLKPVYIGEEIIFMIFITEIVPDRSIMQLKFSCESSTGVAAEGNVKVKYDEGI